jgi:hypothetical protein
LLGRTILPGATRQQALALEPVLPVPVPVPPVLPVPELPMPVPPAAPPLLPVVLPVVLPPAPLLPPVAEPPLAVPEGGGAVVDPDDPVEPVEPEPIAVLPEAPPPADFDEPGGQGALRVAPAAPGLVPVVPLAPGLVVVDPVPVPLVWARTAGAIASSETAALARRNRFI